MYVARSQAALVFLPYFVVLLPLDSASSTHNH